MADLVFALDACTVVDPSSGLKVRLSPGEAWWASDPFVKARPHLFSATPTVVRGVRSVKSVPVEVATAEPGVKRQVKRASEK